MELVVRIFETLARKALLFFTLVLGVGAAGFLYSDPRSPWSWAFAILAVLLILFFAALVWFWRMVFRRVAGERSAPEP